MNISLLRKEHAEVTTRAQNMWRRVKAQAKDERREPTKIELEPIDRLVAEAAQIEAQIDRAEGDASMMNQIDRLVGTGATRRERVGGGGGAAGSGYETWGSIIAPQIIDEFRQAHRPSGTHWSSQVISVHPHAETLTTEGGSPGSGGALIVPDYQPGIRALPQRRLTMVDLMASGTTDSNAITFMKETMFDNQADVVPEGTLKPESGLRFEAETTPVHTFAHWLPVTEQMFEDVPALVTYIDARLRLGLALAIDSALLNGASSPASLNGLLSRSDLLMTWWWARCPARTTPMPSCGRWPRSRPTVSCNPTAS